ncbi:prolyl oligopeptidase family serine peptidase [Flavobacteriaceae bacterium]|nr:prolyl oligopeptidase family serine peptidase [Flavobacteriaceae bacterium]MDA9339137.1 prolyl oligopeptidase family serine peptidase [Flavobacteriaceae bacterium]
MKNLLLIIVFLIFSNSNSQDLELFEKETFEFEKETLSYRILKPLNYNSNKQYPVHLFLHGAGERGNDNDSQLVHGGKLFLKKENREQYNSWVIFPQAQKNDWWGYKDPYKFDYNVKESKAMSLVVKLMDDFTQRKDVDPNKVFVSGLSMGGMGTFVILNLRPEMFAAATPICGDGDPSLVSNYSKKVPVWIFHGSDDTVVSPKKSLKMAKAIIENGGSPKITFYENVGHDSWNNAFAEKDFLKWIHSKSKKQ